VSVVKYRRKIFTPDMEEYFKNICLHIEDGVEITFHEIGIDLDHVHFLIQSIPSRSPSSVVAEIRKETAREMFHQFPDIRKILRR
jgi:putative transposase